ncbi:hypothetical protein HY498_00885 [Candidatus Woesearchaeota archaeon]|nr:hypothetical protein [Candidatus Woesearchaeota archaeon]
MKKTIFILLILVIFLVGCAKKDYNFAYQEIKKLDIKYSGDFKNEMLNGTMLGFDNLSLMRDDLTKLRKDLVKEGVNKTKSAILLVDVRLNMLESEKFWYLGYNLGLEGVTFDGFKCSEVPELLLGRSYFNESFNYGQKAMNLMDSVLVVYPESRALFGVDKDKIKFYDSPLGYLNAIIETNTIAIERYCSYKNP